MGTSILRNVFSSALLRIRLNPTDNVTKFTGGDVPYGDTPKQFRPFINDDEDGDIAMEVDHDNAGKHNRVYIDEVPASILQFFRSYVRDTWIS